MHTKIQKPSTLSSFSFGATYHSAKHWGMQAVYRIAQLVTPKRLLITGVSTFAFLAVTASASFFWPRSVTFSYSQATCFTNPIFLPGLVSGSQSAAFDATLTPGLTIGGVALYSHTTCITPTAPPAEKTSEKVSLAVGPLKKHINVSVGVLPALANPTLLDKPVATREPLVLTLDQADQVFEYQLVANNQQLPCTKQDQTVSCDINALGLAQSASYSFALQRMFEGTPADIILERSITTVEAVVLASSTVAPGQVVYDTPTDFTFTFNKPVASFNGAHLYVISGSDRLEVPVTTSVTDKTITLHLTQPLQRSVELVLEVEQIIAADGSFLASPISVPFKTSGGPKVLGVNIASSKVQPGGSIVLSFDSKVSAAGADKFVRIETASGTVAVSLTVQGNKITLRPAAALPRCTNFTVKVFDGLTNEFGISGGSAWQFKSRTICQTVFSIGTSVQGRSITAYSFGSGPSKIIFVGTTHGDEKSSTYTLNKWIDYLEANADRIPSNRTVIVIPNLNPDAFAASRRTNAHNVDLNRNFPANSWKQGVTMPDQTYNANGGGSAPLSEPESSALASYVLSQSPRLVLTYHAVAGVVIPNDSGDSVALAHTYDQQSNVSFASNSQTGEIFDYDTTGAFEDWLHDKHNIATLLVELRTMSGNEFSKHQNAMWAMIQIP